MQEIQQDRAILNCLTTLIFGPLLEGGIMYHNYFLQIPLFLRFLYLMNNFAF